MLKRNVLESITPSYMRIKKGDDGFTPMSWGDIIGSGIERYNYKERLTQARRDLPSWLKPYVWGVRPNRNEMLIKYKDGVKKWEKMSGRSVAEFNRHYRELIRGNRCEKAGSGQE